MNNLSSAIESVDFIPADDLERLELKIARRADVLSREAGFDPISALDNWRRAEREVMAEIFDFGFSMFDFRKRPIQNLESKIEN